MYVTNPDMLLQLLTVISYEKPLNACLLFEIDVQMTSTQQGNLRVIPTVQKILFFFISKVAIN